MVATHRHSDFPKRPVLRYITFPAVALCAALVADPHHDEPSFVAFLDKQSVGVGQGTVSDKALWRTRGCGGQGVSIDISSVPTTVVETRAACLLGQEHGYGEKRRSVRS